MQTVQSFNRRMVSKGEMSVLKTILGLKLLTVAIKQVSANVTHHVICFAQNLRNSISTFYFLLSTKTCAGRKTQQEEAKNKICSSADCWFYQPKLKLW